MYGILRNLSAAPRFTIVQVENGRKGGGLWWSPRVWSVGGRLDDSWRTPRIPQGMGEKKRQYGFDAPGEWV
jgi:hypothetical protein